MEIKRTSLRAVPCGEGAARAAEILEQELRLRRGTAAPSLPAFTLMLETDAGFGSDDTFEIVPDGHGLRLRANGTRGLIYAVGAFLRKTEFTGGLAAIPEALCGVYTPKKPIRGHQLGYRPCANTYDAWSPAEFERYMIELMYFGMNTVEFIPFTEQNGLMRYTGPEMTRILSEKAHALGLEVSLWIPNTDKSEAEELAEREALFRAVPYIDAVFIPGADPGSLPADTLIDRCNKIYELLIKYHPNAKLWPSAQAPHNAPGWGEAFLAALKNAGPGIAGVITGPNRAFNVDELRRRLPEKYPIRFYPDVTHNLRCEHPVHFDRDDWHYAFANTLSRESVNPRPEEYKRLFGTVAPYTVGSVTYSDGVNDDVNKAVWCALEWDDTLTAAEIAEDYARAYLYEYPSEETTAAILLLEKNWSGSPLEKRIDFTAHLLGSLKRAQNPWRFYQLWFRALCDLYVKNRMLEDTAAYGAAALRLSDGDAEAAKTVLLAPPSEGLRRLRSEIDRLARMLFETVGMQLSVEEYGASGWERGATLDTIDLPITDRQWLLHLLNTLPPEKALGAIHRNDVEADEFYFSFALHWPQGAGQTQAPDFYMNIQGDRPDVNDGALPMCLAKVYDHFTFDAQVRGLQTGMPYTLTVTFFKADEHLLREMTVTANGVRLSPPVPSEETALLPPRFSAFTYEIPASAVTDGALRISLSEQTAGFQIAELKITHRRETA